MVHILVFDAKCGINDTTFWLHLFVSKMLKVLHFHFLKSVFILVFHFYWSFFVSFSPHADLMIKEHWVTLAFASKHLCTYISCLRSIQFYLRFYSLEYARVLPNCPPYLNWMSRDQISFKKCVAMEKWLLWQWQAAIVTLFANSKSKANIDVWFLTPSFMHPCP